MAWIATVLFNIGLFLAFGWQSWRQKRRTGSTGFVGMAAATSRLQRFSSLGFVLALIIDEVALIAAAWGGMDSMAPHPLVAVTGLTLMVGGLGLVLTSQLAMGDSWRVGVKAGEVTALVTDGVFRHIRNPIFSGMLVANLGALLMAPSWPLLVGLLLLWGAIDAQVRHIEEPHLEATHGEVYRRYKASSGRYLPSGGAFR